MVNKHENVIENVTYLILFSADPDSLAIANLTRDVAILGKNNEVVYVNIPAQFHSGIELLLKMQPIVGVNPANPFVFGKVGKELKYRDHRNFYTEAAHACGASNPELLGSQGQRRKICTNVDVSL
jgi:hypothetical protein